ncbi:MAG: glycerol-3-phosphate dehydrogenase [bacterium]
MKREIQKLSSETFDLLIIGGGINGCGILRDAALRGYRAALVEKGDFASGTSSKTSKLVHGGLRYLEQMEFGLVFESCRERRTLQAIAPHLVLPLPFLIPVYKGDARGRTTIHAGMVLYDMLALFRNVERHRMVSSEEALKAEPDLQRAGLQGGAVYYDCQMDDARLCLENVLSAAEAGAVAANYAEVLSLIKNGERVAGAVVRDLLSGQTFEVMARKVINASGPWIDRISKMGSPESPPRLRPTKGVHIIVPGSTRTHALLISARRDNRIFFVIPYQGYSLIGTTDTFYAGDPDEVEASPEDIAYLIEESRRVIPGAELSRDHVIASFAGLRPLVAEPGRPSELSRGHVIYEERSGLLTVAGGKYTTYRQVAEEVVDRIAGGAEKRSLVPCRTAQLPLYGGDLKDLVSTIKIASERSVSEYGIGPDTAAHLVRCYGSRYRDVLDRIREDEGLRERIVPGGPEILAQVRYGVEREMVKTLSDFLRRRTSLALSGANGRDTAGRVASVLAHELHWDAKETERQIHAYLKDR